jgi:hypothetical protein
VVVEAAIYLRHGEASISGESPAWHPGPGAAKDYDSGCVAVGEMLIDDHGLNFLRAGSGRAEEAVCLPATVASLLFNVPVAQDSCEAGGCGSVSPPCAAFGCIWWHHLPRWRGCGHIGYPEFPKVEVLILVEAVVDLVNVGVREAGSLERSQQLLQCFGFGEFVLLLMPSVHLPLDVT